MGTLIQSAFKAAGAVSSSTLAFPSNITAGSLIVVHIWSGVANTNTSSSSDSKNGAHTQSAALANAAGSFICSTNFFPNAAAGATTVTFSATASGQLRCLIQEFS